MLFFPVILSRWGSISDATQLLLSPPGHIHRNNKKTSIYSYIYREALVPEVLFNAVFTVTAAACLPVQGTGLVLRLQLWRERKGDMRSVTVDE